MYWQNNTQNALVKETTFEIGCWQFQRYFETKELAERFKKENEGKIEYYRLPFSSVVALEMDNE
jgi:hypothetical protein